MGGKDAEDVHIHSNVCTGEAESHTRSCVHLSKGRGHLCVGCLHGRVCRVCVPPGTRKREK